MDYDLLGFKIRASDIRIHVDPKKIDDTETRVDIPLLLAKDIKVSNGGLINSLDMNSAADQSEDIFSGGSV